VTDRVKTGENERLVGELLAGMDLRRKIGQMLLCGFEGTEPSADILRLIGERHLGGVIYFARNVASVRQVAKLSADLQTAAASGGNVPLWISIDQEGGMVARMTEGVALMPGNMAIAASGSPEAAREAALVTGRELKAMGISLNFAPVLDVNNNPANPVIGVRSYGESPEAVAAFGAQAIRGLQKAGVTATAKHFPGHGDTDVDSHLDLPTVLHDRGRMERVELVPFRRAIEAGVDAIMSSHIYFPALEREKLPATLSHSVLTGLLREELGFEGVIMTDCMEMNAIAGHYGTVNAAVMAVAAGADVVMVSHTFARQTGAIDAICEAVRDGRIAEERIDASVRRILACKLKRGVIPAGNGDERRVGGVSAAVGNGGTESRGAVRDGAGSTGGGVGDGGEHAVDIGGAESRAVARRISEGSVTLVRDEQAVLPLKRERTLAVTVGAAVTSEVDESIGGAGSLGAALAAHGLDVLDRVVQPEASDDWLDRLIADALAGGISQIVFGTYNAQFSPAQQEAVRRLNGLGKALAVVALRNPYDLLTLPDDTAYAAVYESRPLALESAAKALLGLIPFRGRLPVSLGDRYPAGWRWGGGNGAEDGSGCEDQAGDSVRSGTGAGAGAGSGNAECGETEAGDGAVDGAADGVGDQAGGKSGEGAGSGLSTVSRGTDEGRTGGRL